MQLYDANADLIGKSAIAPSRYAKLAVPIVHHVGSTSVPGLAAKPIIDLMPVVTNLAKLDRERRCVEALGYRTVTKIEPSTRKRSAWLAAIWGHSGL
jgi:GrpB-like predicted nucleotidyltransferase (UPF0157 family)